MYELLLVLVVILFLGLRYRETFVVKYGNPFNDEDVLSFEPNAKGKRIFALTPDTCPKDKPDLDAGLCYPSCDEGYHGVGPVCWADTVNVGIGKVLLLKSCYESGHIHSDDNSEWADGGLLCFERWGWDNCAWKSIFGCVGGVKGGGIRPKQLSCDGYGDRENVDALCYKKCPVRRKRDGTTGPWSHVPAMPYLCYEGSRGLSYGRGVGGVPPLFSFGE
jgi:hypothetical protein